MDARRLLLLTALGLLGFVVAPEASDKDSPSAAQTGAAPPKPEPVMDGLKIPYKEYATRVRSRWM